MGESKSNRGRLVLVVLVNLISLGFLVWTLRDVRPGALWADVASLNWWWIALAVILQLSAYFCQGLRWSMILASLQWLRPMASTRAVFVGIFASEVLPIRAGEVLRCYLVSRWTSIPFSVSLSSVVIERTFDGLLMWLGLQYALSSMLIPTSVKYGTRGLGIFVLIGVIFLSVALFGLRRRETPLPESGWRRRIAILLDDLARIGHSWYLLWALLLTIPYLLAQTAPVWILFRGYGFDLSFKAAFGLMLILRVAAALPQAPATLGLFQVLTKEFLELAGVMPAEAARFSLVLWAAIKLPLLAGGAIALAVTGAKIGELRKQAAEAT